MAEIATMDSRIKSCCSRAESLKLTYCGGIAKCLAIAPVVRQNATRPEPVTTSKFPVGNKNPTRSRCNHVLHGPKILLQAVFVDHNRFSLVSPRNAAGCAYCLRATGQGLIAIGAFEQVLARA